jgi:uncharacterized protein HemX
MTKLLELIDGFRVVHEEIIARRHQEKSRLKRNSPKALLQLEEVNIITQQSIDLELSSEPSSIEELEDLVQKNLRKCKTQKREATATKEEHNPTPPPQPNQPEQ